MHLPTSNTTLSNTILLTGESGQLGSELVNMLAPLGTVVSLGRTELDLADASNIRSAVRAVRPRWIVHPAAYTAVDKAESEPDLAYSINATATQTLGEEARRIDAAVLTFSTDYVFDGSGHAPWRETDPTGPLNVYGASKLAGEQALAASGASHLIFRTSWVYGARGKNFVRTILRLAAERSAISIINDQHGAPTSAGELARMTRDIVRRIEAGALPGQSAAELVAPFNGTYHTAAAGETTWCGFAQEIIRNMRERRPNQVWAEVKAIPTADYPTPAKRPLNSRLDCSKLAETFHWTMLDWRTPLTSVLDETTNQESPL